jgi:hypothetical protein
MTPLMVGNLGLEVVIVGFFSQFRKHLGPYQLIDEYAKGVVSPDECMDITLTEHVRKPLLQNFKMSPDSRPDHDAVRIENLAVLFIFLPGTNRTKEAIFSKNPHWLSFLLLNEAFLNELAIFAGNLVPLPYLIGFLGKIGVKSSLCSYPKVVIRAAQ